jgi:rhodanese-related sulfurtransferase
MTSSPSYAGDISVQDAWDRLKSDANAQLIDVRTRAEWNFVGLPDLGALGRRPLTIEWQSFPDGAPNPHFVEQAKAAVGDDKGVTLLMLCRSGARSRAAAIAMAAAGFAGSFNIAGGFEGDVDGAGHRGTVNGWKAAGLPWRQG